MEFSIKSDTAKSGWSIVLIGGSQFIQIKYHISFSEYRPRFVLANSADPDEMPHHAAFHLGLHCLLKYPLRDLCPSKGLATKSLPFRMSLKFHMHASYGIFDGYVSLNKTHCCPTICAGAIII